MTKDPDGPGGAGNYYNSLGVVDDVPDEEFDARFRALDPAALRQEYGGDAIRFNGPRRFLGDRFTAVAFDGGSQSMLGPSPMYLYGTFVVPDFDAFIAGKQVPYHETVSRRTTTWFFDAGFDYAWVVGMQYGNPSSMTQGNINLVWAVRGQMKEQ